MQLASRKNKKGRGKGDGRNDDEVGEDRTGEMENHRSVHKWEYERNMVKNKRLGG